MWILLFTVADALCATHSSCSQCIAEFWDTGSCAWFVPHDKKRPSRCLAAALRSSPAVDGVRRFEVDQAGLEIVAYDHDRLSKDSCYRMDCAKKPGCPYLFVKVADVPCSDTYDPVWRIITCCSRQANEGGFIEGFNVVNNIIDGYMYYMRCCPYCHPGTYLETIEPHLCQQDLACNMCPSGTYNQEQGLLTKDFCLECDVLTCPFGQRRVRCGNAYKGSCVDCDPGYWGEACAEECTTCPTARYRIGCGNTQEGTCELCPLGTFWAAPECRECQSCAYATGTHRILCMGSNSGVCARCPSGQYEASVGVCSPCGACPESELRLGCGAENQGGCVKLVSARLNDDLSALTWTVSGDVYPFGGASPQPCLADYGSGCSSNDLSVGYWVAHLMRGDLGASGEASVHETLGQWWPAEAAKSNETVGVDLPASVSFPLTAYFVRVSYVDDQSSTISVSTATFSLPDAGMDFPFYEAVDAVWGRTVKVNWLSSLQRVDAWSVFRDPWTVYGKDIVSSVGIQEVQLYNDWDIQCPEVCSAEKVEKIASLWNNTKSLLASTLNVHLVKLGQMVADMKELDGIIASMAARVDFSYVNVAQGCTRAVYRGTSNEAVLQCFAWLIGATHSHVLRPHVSWIHGNDGYQPVDITPEWDKFASAVADTYQDPELDTLTQVVQEIGALVYDTAGGTRNLHIRTYLPHLEILHGLFAHLDPRSGIVGGFGLNSPLDDEVVLENAGVEMQQLLQSRMFLFLDIVRLSGASNLLIRAMEQCDSTLPAELALYTSTFHSRADPQPWIQDRASEIFAHIVKIGAAVSELAVGYAWQRIRAFRRNYFPDLKLSRPRLSDLANVFQDERAQANIDFNDYIGANEASGPAERYRGFAIYDIQARTHPGALALAPATTAFTVLPLPPEAKLLRKVQRIRRLSVYAFMRGHASMKTESETSCIPQSMAQNLTSEQLANGGLRLCGSTEFIQVRLRSLGDASIVETKHESTKCFVNSMNEGHEGALYTTWFVEVPNVADMQYNDLRIFFEVDFKANGALTQYIFLGQKGDKLYDAFPSQCKDEPIGDYYLWPTQDIDAVQVNQTDVSDVDSGISNEPDTVTFGPGIDEEEEEEEEDELDDDRLNSTLDIGNLDLSPVQFTKTTTVDTTSTGDTQWREWAIAAGIVAGFGLFIPGLYLLMRKIQHSPWCKAQFDKRCPSSLRSLSLQKYTSRVRHPLLPRFLQKYTSRVRHPLLPRFLQKYTSRVRHPILPRFVQRYTSRFRLPRFVQRYTERLEPLRLRCLARWRTLADRLPAPSRVLLPIKERVRRLPCVAPLIRKQKQRIAPEVLDQIPPDINEQPQFDTSLVKDSPTLSKDSTSSPSIEEEPDKNEQPQFDTPLGKDSPKDSTSSPSIEEEPEAELEATPKVGTHAEEVIKVTSPTSHAVGGLFLNVDMKRTNAKRNWLAILQAQASDSSDTSSSSSATSSSKSFFGLSLAHMDLSGSSSSSTSHDSPREPAVFDSAVFDVSPKSSPRENDEGRDSERKADEGRDSERAKGGGASTMAKSGQYAPPRRKQ